MPICGIMVFEPGNLSGLDFQTWLAQIDDAASDDVFVDYLGPKHATVLWEQSKTLIVTFEHHSTCPPIHRVFRLVGNWRRKRGGHICALSANIRIGSAIPMSSAILIG